MLFFQIKQIETMARKPSTKSKLPVRKSAKFEDRSQGMSSPAIKRPQMRFKTKQNNASKRSLEQLPGYITTQAFNQYRCAKIIEEREVTTKEYRTRWSGYGSDHDTWLLETAFVNNLALEEWNQTKQAEQLPAREQ